MARKSEHEETHNEQQSHSKFESLHSANTRRPGGEKLSLFAYLFQVSSDGMVVHERWPSLERGRIIDVNDRLCEMLSYTRVEILERTLLDLLDERAGQVIPEMLQKARASDQTVFEVTLVAKDGRSVPVEVSLHAPMPDERHPVLSVVRDLTERKRMEDQSHHWKDELEEEVCVQTEELRNVIGRLHEEMARRLRAENQLRERSQMLEAFFRNTITPLAFLDRHFNFVRVNEAYARAAGKCPEYFVGRNYFVLYPDEEDQAIFEHAVRSQQPHFAHARPFTYPDQPQRGITYWDWRLTPLCDDFARVRFLVLSLEDVTERQRAVQELERRARQLRKVTIELTEAEDRERKRLAEILHDDLQQTLAAAKFHLGLLDDRARVDAGLAEIVGQIKQMLKDGIEKSRSLSHELGPAVLSQSSLDDTFAWLAHQMQRRHGLAVHVETRGRVDSSESVRTFLYRAAQEILFNVVKHAQVPEAKLRLQRVRDQVRMIISDKGLGFDLGSLAQTTGFGLMRVRERAEFLGGRMRIKSTVGKGSTFLVAVPDMEIPPVTCDPTMNPAGLPGMDCG